MARLFVCTAGTSIVTNLREALEPVGTFGIRMREKLKDAKAKTGDRFLADASAELNVLLSMKCAGDDEVVLLASDTNLGKAAADTVCTLVTADLGAAVRVVKVTGLQTTDARAFRRNRMHKPPGRETLEAFGQAYCGYAGAGDQASALGNSQCVLVRSVPFLSSVIGQPDSTGSGGSERHLFVCAFHSRTGAGLKTLCGRGGM